MLSLSALREAICHLPYVRHEGFVSFVVYRSSERPHPTGLRLVDAAVQPRLFDTTVFQRGASGEPLSPSSGLSHLFSNC